MHYHSISRLSGTRWTTLVIFILLLGLGGAPEARQFRLLIPIATHEAPTAQLPEGAIPVDEVTPWQRSELEPIVRDLIAKWNTPQMAETLDEGFYDKSRLLDSINSGLPREATLRLQSIQGIQTLQQYVVPDPDGITGKRVTLVSVTVRTQIEFNSPTQGFVNRPGVIELILKITTPTLL